MYEAKTYNFRDELMAEVKRRQESGQWRCGDHVLPDPDVPKNIAPVERGSKQAVIDSYISRFRPR